MRASLSRMSRPSEFAFEPDCEDIARPPSRLFEQCPGAPTRAVDGLAFRHRYPWSDISDIRRHE